MARWMILMALWGLPGTFVWADCQTSFDEAVGVLNVTQDKIQKDSHPSPDTFATEFQEIVQKMQTEKCLPELKKLVEHIQAEQKKYPALPNEKPLAMPITD